MFLNNLKIAWRSILKNKLFSFINVIGLSIGLCSALVIGAIVYFDFSFDNFHKDRDRIYRVTTLFESGENEFSNRGVSVPLMKEFRNGISGVEVSAPFMSTYFSTIENKAQDLVFRNENNGILADGAYFEIFDYNWLAGDNQTALSEPAQVVLTKIKAEKYFPHKNVNEVIGQTLVYNDSVNVKVMGVVDDLKQNSDLKFTEFMSLSSAKMFDEKDIETSDAWNGTSSGDQLFFKVKEGASVSNIQSRLDELAKEHKNMEPWAVNDERWFRIQPFSEIHFGGAHGDYPFNNSNHVASMKVLKSLAFIALFLLLLGCANFINLNSAQALTRAKEIGIRKTLGSSKKQVVRQFLGETFILTTMAAVFSILMAPLLLRQFADFLPSDIDLSVLYSSQGVLGIVLLVVLVSLLSGFYPAFVLSKFRPVSVLKGQFSKGDKGVKLRKTLTIFQFVVAQVFVIGTLLVGKQLHFLMNKDMGIKTEAVAYINLPWNDRSEVKKERVFNQIKNIKGLSQVSWGDNPPASNNMSSTMLSYYKDGNETHQEAQMLTGDISYLKTYGIPLIAGRERLNDSIDEYVVNETFARAIGFQNPEEVVGTSVKLDTVKIAIVGVIKDFNQRSLRSEIRPLAVRGHYSRGFDGIHFDLGNNPERWTQIIDEVEEVLVSVYPDEELEVRFMDETVKGFYRQEKSAVQLLKWATGLAILISCLGLMGLVVYTTERRVKEIGVRKVLGANLAQLNILLCKEFLILVAVAFAVAVPISWYLVQEWIESFAYKTELSWWVFLASGIGMAVIAMAVTGARTYKTANINPIESLRNEQTNQSKTKTMFKNYLKIAWRNLIKNKIFSVANIVGLTCAFAVSILLTMTALFELSFDQFHLNKDSAYQVYLTNQTPRGAETSTSNPVPLASALKEEVPGIKRITRTLSEDALISFNDKDLDLDAEYVDAEFFNIFTFPVIAGNISNPLPSKNAVSITEETATKMFGNTDVVGKVVQVQIGGEEHPFTIASILENTPPNSSIDFDIVIPFENHPEYESNKDVWNSQFHPVYLQLEDGMTPQQFEINSRAFANLHYKGSIESDKRDGASPDENGQYKQFHLLPVEDLHFATFKEGLVDTAHTFPYLILGVALVIIFIVCANFINMNIALSEKRLKEIGMRKTLGAVKKQLFFQFWMESLIVFLIAIGLGLLVSNLLIGPFKTLFVTKATFANVTQPGIIALFVISIFVITLIAGGYPALILSKLSTLRALKGKLDFGKNRLRNGLIVLQFVIAIILISGTLVLHGQIEFLRNKDLGYNKEQVVSIPLNGRKDSYAVLELLRDELSQAPGVLSVSGSDSNLGLGKDGSITSSAMGFDYKGRGLITNALTVDYDYAKTLDIELLEGRMFDKKYSTDSLSLVINESMAKQFGEDDPLSIRINMDDSVTYSVVGVIKDYYFQDVKREVKPLTLFLNRNWDLYYAYVKIAPDNAAQSFDAIKAAWEKIEPQADFLGSFLDENVDRTFKREKTLATIITSGSILGIILSCLGLFAISMLVVAQRTKEIGVRKVVGASISSVALLLTKDFLKLVGLAFIIATPISWYFLNEWLQDYASHVSLSPLFFVAAGLTATLIAFITVGSRTVKAASANPVKSLRDE